MTDVIIKFIDAFKWPAVALVIVWMFSKQIKNLISKTKSFKTDKIKFEAEPLQIQTASEQLANPKGQQKVIEIERALNLFNGDTRELFKKLIITETNFDHLGSDREKSEALFKYSEFLYITLVFERIHYNIFGTQLDLLTFLNSANPQSSKSLEVFFEVSVARNPDIKEYGYDRYLGFLKYHQLILVNPDETLSITWKGRDFLKWITERGLRTDKEN